MAGGPRDGMDAGDLAMLAGTFRKAMTGESGRALDLALTGLGWRDLLGELPGVAIPLVFGLLGETGAHAPLLNDVLLAASSAQPGGTVPLPYAGGSWVLWAREDRPPGTALDGDLPLRRWPQAGPAIEPAALAAGRRAIGWWLLGAGRAMLSLARAHAVDRVQFGRPIASFQAVRHRLAETLVALDGAEAALAASGENTASGENSAGADDELSSLLAKAAAGHAALIASRGCQQVLGGIGFTAEHPLHVHVKRVLVLDGLLGSARELTIAAGRRVIRDGAAPRLADL